MDYFLQKGLQELKMCIRDSHGGLGGDQSYPFVMYPSEWKLETETIIGAEKLHEVLKARLNQKSQ